MLFEPNKYVLPHQAIRVLCLSTWPSNTAPGPRFRCEAYFAPLADLGVDVDQASFLTHQEYSATRKLSARALVILLKAMVRSLAAVRRVRGYDVVWLLREAAPVGPPLIEFVVLRLLRKPAVFDFDDAIWLPQSKEPVVEKLIRCRAKTRFTIKNARFVIAGNEFLASFARALGARTKVIPTCVDTNRRFNKVHIHNKNAKPVVGWTGSRSTNNYLKFVGDILKELREKLDFDIVVISDAPLDFSFPDYKYYDWTPATEIKHLDFMDIGVMPLADTEWEKGKCGFKLIQYMALGIPPVASAVGANMDIVRDGVDGFLCKDREDWMRHLRSLIEDPLLRERIGRSGRQRIVDRFSIDANVKNLASTLEEASGRGGHSALFSRREN